MYGEEEAFDMDPISLMTEKHADVRERTAFFYQELLPALNLERYDETDFDGSTLSDQFSVQQSMGFLLYARKQLPDAEFVTLLHYLGDFARGEIPNWTYLVLKIHQLLATSYEHVLLSFRAYFLNQESAENIPCSTNTSIDHTENGNVRFNASNASNTSVTA